MTDRVPVNLRVPKCEVEHFRDWAKDKFGEVRPYVGVESERAVKNWLDLTAESELESEVDRLVRAAGRVPENRDEKKNQRQFSNETIPIQWHWSEDTRARFMHEAAQRSLRSPGRLLAAILESHRNGTAVERALTKLRRVSDDAEAILKEIDTDSDEGLSLRERRTIALCNKFSWGEYSIHREGVEKAIERIAGGSKPTIETYLDLTLERVEYTYHPHNDDIFIPRPEAICIELNPESRQFHLRELENAITKVLDDNWRTIDTYTDRVLGRLDHVPHPEREDVFVPPEKVEEIEQRESASTTSGTQSAPTAVADGGEPRLDD